jgi:hypothetical protein
MDSSGWAASSIGFVLVGYIVGGASIGWWLDSRLKTSYWLPILFLVGVAGGFREMFRMLKLIQQMDAAKRKETESRRRQAPPVSTVEMEATPESVRRERIFEVPPPPFLDNEVAKAGPSQRTDSEGIDDLIEKLLRDGEDESPPPRST